MKRKSKSDVRKLKDQLWQLCRAIVKQRHGATCYTCGAPNLSGSNFHTGHCIPSSVGGVQLRYHLDNLRPQCAACNIWKSGNSALFLRRLMTDLGEERVDQMIALKNSIVRADKFWYQQKIEEYQGLIQG